MPRIQDDDAAAPSLALALSELPRALLELGSIPIAAPLLSMAKRGDGHPVLVLPGFLTSDTSTSLLRRFLKSLGYDVHTWDLGRNLGPRAIGHEGEKLIERLDCIHDLCGEKISLVGWSLGGMMARQLARRRPDLVRQIITLGSPIVGNPRATNAWRAYEAMTGQKIDAEAARVQLRESETPPPVPSTAIYTKEDGVVSWRNCIEPKADLTDNIQVYGSHCGLGVNPVVLYAVADRLAQPEGTWKPFDRSGLMRQVLYPSSGHVH